jgi:predicted nicotinamide N-methyase
MTGRHHVRGWLGPLMALSSMLLVRSMVVVERRRCVLKPWIAANEEERSSTMIGWTLEERTELGDLRVTVGLGNEIEEDSSHRVTCDPPITIDLIRTQTDLDDKHKDDESSSSNNMAPADDLASSLWPAGIAGAILERHYADALSTLSDTNAVNDRRVLELGSGVGLYGWTAAARARSVAITDHDEAAIDRLTALIAQNKEDDDTATSNAAKVSAQFLEWRDETDESLRSQFDWIVGTAVAYYFFLLRPLMDTIRACLSEDAHSKLLVVGQTNRESQWDLYDNLVDGCYNQLTDEREPPWPGRTRMVLYKLEMSEWMKGDSSDTAGSSTKFDLDGSVPIAALLYEREPNTPDFLTESDRVATPEDREGMLMSF